MDSYIKHDSKTFGSGLEINMQGHPSTKSGKKILLSQKMHNVLKRMQKQFSDL